MNYLKATGLFLLAAVAGLPAANGQQRQIVTTITSLSDAVTYSAATETYVVGYTVTISNAGNNTVNNVRFVGTTSVPDLVVGYKGSNGITCDPVSNADRTNTNTTVTCQLGTATAGFSKTFSVFFYSPVNTVDNASRTVAFNATTIYAEGTTDNPNNPPANDTRYDTVATVVLGTPSPSEVKSALTPDGGTFFTAPVDQFSSKVTVPPQQKSSSVTLLESASTDVTTCSSLKNFNTCYKSAITVPDVVFTSSSGNFLTFVLRVDSADIRKGSKIGKVVIRYSASGVPELNIPAISLTDLQFCAKDGSNNAIPNSNYEPCIAKANDFTRKGSSGFFGYEWIILNLKNGDFELF
jgi:uncharacterized protein affecting Mg2+/Co2+ transport